MLVEASARDVAIEVHLEQLEYVNSSTVICIIRLIQDARTNGVRLEMSYSPRLKWQKLTCDSLRAFAKPDGMLRFQPV